MEELYTWDKDLLMHCLKSFIVFKKLFRFRTVLDKQHRTHCSIVNLYDIWGELSFHFLFQPSSAKNVNTGNHRFNSISSSFAATFFMMLDNLQYDNILLNYNGSTGNGLVLYVLYIAYCFMMPIIFLNLLVSSLWLFFLFPLFTFFLVLAYQFSPRFCASFPLTSFKSESLRSERSCTLFSYPSQGSCNFDSKQHISHSLPWIFTCFHSR